MFFSVDSKSPKNGVVYTFRKIFPNKNEGLNLQFSLFLVYMIFFQKCLTCTLNLNYSCMRGLILLVAFNGKRGAVGKLELRFSRLSLCNTKNYFYCYCDRKSQLEPLGQGRPKAGFFSFFC